MSTLVSILLAVVMNLLSGVGFSNATVETSKAEIIHCENGLPTIEAYYIIKDEQLFQTN
ncbi:hypothetical protein ATE92_2006 [Ulvibacter sp. MAR_2010_11]|uniref:hypothetical protein n=1 Tax=Ulvibacter sp. MAR_2010_11 TaxID=1250229 RepID=UPI000CC4EC4F|nr:hypothetical protein [Ulvibacter sp. MAR_2010_11]PKA83838.1 hypothetical protein ATE92_2006 [Ulvibacter sp. MAR_2010_11]